MTSIAATDDQFQYPDLICAPDRIFDTASFQRGLDRARDNNATPVEIRAEAVKLLRAAQIEGRQAIAEAFAEAPFEARLMKISYTYLTDQLVISALRVATGVLHPKPNPTASERLAVIAVGGYGRGEMAPFSDVDLLFLTPYKITAWAESVIESMLYMLWVWANRVFIVLPFGSGGQSIGGESTFI